MDIKPVVKQNNAARRGANRPPVMKLLTEITITHWVSFKEELPVFDSWGPHRKGGGSIFEGTGVT